MTPPEVYHVVDDAQEDDQANAEEGRIVLYLNLELSVDVHVQDLIID